MITGRVPERWLSGRKRRFAKSVMGEILSAGSNPALSAYENRDLVTPCQYKALRGLSFLGSSHESVGGFPAENAHAPRRKRVHPDAIQGMGSLPKQSRPTGAPGCVYVLSSNNCTDTRGLCTGIRSFPNKRVAGAFRCRFDHARGAVQSVRAAGSPVPDTTTLPSVRFNSCRCGAWRCFSCTVCGGSIAGIAE